MLPQCPPAPDRPNGNFSSGVGVGLNVAYLTADGCDFFFSYAKSPTYLSPSDCPPQTPPNPFYCPGKKLNYFHYDGHRAEDLECDDVTFAPRDVMWVRDEQDTDFQFRAYELPTGTCIFGGGVSVSNGGANGTASTAWMTGGGSVLATLPLGAQARHGFMLHCDPSQKPNQLEINWGNGNKFHLTQLGSSSCTKNPALPDNGRSFNTLTGSGTGRYNGVGGATASWTFQDAGEPGTSDMGTLTVKDKDKNTVLVASGMLVTGPVPGSGNYRAHDGK